MKKLLYILPAVIVALALSFLPGKALAAYDPGLVITDAQFSARNTMSEAQIQAFLVSKGSFLANYTVPAPRTVTYYIDSTRTLTTYENTVIGPYGVGSEVNVQGWKASRLIWQVSQWYGVNPQVVLTIIEKESNFILGRTSGRADGSIATPGANSYATYAWIMGYAYTEDTSNPAKNVCGTATPGANPTKSCAGLAAQLDNATWAVANWANLANTHDTGNGFTCSSWSDYYWTNDPFRLCDNEIVTARSGATAALYRYTPHTGLTGGYSGNRAFYLIFTNWFDSSSFLQNNLVMNTVAIPDSTPARGQDVSYSVSFTSSLPYDITLDAVGIVGRAGDVFTGPNRDFGWQGPVVLNPGVAKTFTFTTSIRDIGNIYAWPAVYYQGNYVHYNNWGIGMNAHTANLSLTSPLTLTPTNPVVGQAVTLQASVTNNEQHPIRVDSMGIPVRYFGQYGYDVAWTTTAGYLGSGATQSLSGSTVFDKPGPYTAWVSWNMSGLYTSLSPVSSYSVTTLSPSFTLTYIETPNPKPAVGESIAIKFKLRNNLSAPITLDAVGVVGRYSNPYSGANRDLGWVGPETFTANQEKSYTTFVSTVTELNNFYSWIAINYRGSYTHFNNWGFMMVPHTPNISIITPLTINGGASVSAGETVLVTTTLKNNEAHSIHFEALGLPIRFYGVYSYDTGWVGPVTLAASGQAGDTLPLAGTVKLDKPGPYSSWISLNVQGVYSIIGNIIQLRVS